MTPMRHKVRIILSLMVPIVFFSGLVASKQWTRDHGIEVRLPIEGFDPRDLLSGHYLIYRINYGVAVCPSNRSETIPDAASGEKVPAYVCLNPRSFRFGNTKNPECGLTIRGACRGEQFLAGVERFYIPEAYAHPLDAAVRNKSGEIILSVTDSGTASVKGLLIGGRPWQEAVTPEPVR
ncbi:MAG: GDYXXLXY domain-containing protein [Nitrospirae bacterium]|nr:GDYXXLXY domain-containing protein [Magnetococcales bacterium]